MPIPMQLDYGVPDDNLVSDGNGVYFQTALPIANEPAKGICNHTYYQLFYLLVTQLHPAKFMSILIFLQLSVIFLLETHSSLAFPQW